MSALPSARHEVFAEGLAEGLTADTAYAKAGYKPHRSNAARLSANDSIKDRVAEIQQARLKNTMEHAAIDTREQLHKLIKIVDMAIEAKDIKNALDGQKAIMELFGYFDMPTMSHDHFSSRRAPLAPTEAAQPEQQQGNILRLGRGHMEVRKLIASRVAAKKAKEALQDETRLGN